MRESFDRRSFAAMLGVFALAACTPDEEAPPPESAAAESVRSYRYDGLAGSSRVTREAAEGGREMLRGITDLALQGRASERTISRESATIDARGRLESAEIIVAHSGTVGARYTLDATRGTVRIERPGAAPLDWRVPADVPWLYSPGESPPDGRSERGAASDTDASDVVVTPVAAWVALRAAGAGEVVRVLEPQYQRSYLVMRDQISVPTERGTTVAIGSHGADADARFVSELRLFQGAVTLARVSSTDLGA